MGDPRLILTSQQFRAASLAARMHTIDEIGSYMGITPRTARFHLDQARHRLRLHSKAALAREMQVWGYG